MLGREGVSRERLRGVFTPIGLPIGAESPEEIALSIVAELVPILRKGHAGARDLTSCRRGFHMTDQEIFEKLTEEINSLH